MILINDQNAHQVCGTKDANGHLSVNWKGEQRFFGRLPRKTPYGQLACAEKMPLELIPRDEWCDRIEQNDKDESWAQDVFKQGGNKVLDQNGLSYCHAFSCVDAMMIQRARQGLKYVELSAGSIGGPVTGYRNAGAAIEDDLRQAKEHGAASTEFVDMRQTDSKWKEGAKANALLHCVTIWWDLDPSKMVDSYVTSALMGYPICVGYDWWSHAVTVVRIGPATDLASLAAAIKSRGSLSGALKTLILNSWGTSYGEGGCGWLTGSKQIPNEAYVPAQITASQK